MGIVRGSVEKMFASAAIRAAIVNAFVRLTRLKVGGPRNLRIQYYVF